MNGYCSSQKPGLSKNPSARYGLLPYELTKAIAFASDHSLGPHGKTLLLRTPHTWDSAERLIKLDLSWKLPPTRPAG